MNKKILIIIFIGILIISLLITGTKNKPNLSRGDNVTPSPAYISKVYRNPYWGFSFEYPSSWVFESEEPEKEMDHYGFYGDIKNKPSRDYSGALDYVGVGVGVTNPQIWLGKEMTEDEFLNVDADHWKIKSSGEPGYTYLHPKVVKINNIKFIEQPYHPSKSYQASTPDQMVYAYHFWQKGNIYTLSFEINNKNPKLKEALETKNKILSTFKP